MSCYEFSFKKHFDDSFEGILGQENCYPFGKNLCSGKGSSSGGGGTNTVTQEANPPPQVLAAYQTAIQAAQNAASQPLQQYTGPTVAGFTPDQLAAFQTVAGTSGAATPYLNTASQDIQNSTTPLWSGVPQFSQSGVDKYLSPYTNDVLSATMAAQNNQDAIQQNGVVGNAIASGAWGGDRSAVAQALTAGQQAIANNATNANILNTGYSTALGEFNNQQQQQLSADEANAYLNSQAGFGNINLAQNAVSIPLEQANAQSSAGAQQQALGQSILNVPYQQFLQQQAYPFQTAQFFANAAEGLGPGQGSSGTSTSTGPGASTASQVGGGLLGFGGLLGGLLAAKEGGRIPQYKSGGRTHYDIGDNIPNFDVSIVPASSSPGTHYLPLPSAPNTTTPTSPSNSDIISGTKGLFSIGSLLGGLGGSGGAGAGGIGGLDNALGGTGSDVAAEGASSEGLSAVDSASFLDSFSFKGGGKIPQYSEARKFASGGGPLTVLLGSGDKQTDENNSNVKHSNGWMANVGKWIGSIIGHTIGAPFGGTIWGAPAGEDAGGTLGDLFGGNFDSVGSDVRAGPLGGLLGANNSAQGNGNPPQLGGNFSNTSYFKSGGSPRGHYDDGGNISPVSGAQPSDFDSGQLQQNFYQQIANLPVDKLEQLQNRYPPATKQGQMVQRILKQKQFMPNSLGSTQAGLSTSSMPQAGYQQIQDPSQAQAGFAMGGRPRFDNGGYPTPPSPDQIYDQLSPQDQIADDVANEPMPLPPQPGLQLANATPSTLPLPTSSNENDSEEQILPVKSEPKEESKGTRQKADPWEALATAGFGMMAGTSPQAGVNIGRGALAGLQNYEEQKKQIGTQNYQSGQLDQEGKKLAAQVDQWNKENELKHEQMNVGKYDVKTDNFGNMYKVNTRTGEVVPVSNGVNPLLPLAGAATSSPPMVTAPVDGGAPVVTPSNNQPPANTAAPVGTQMNALPQDYQERLAKYPSQLQPIIKGVIEGRIPPDRSHLGMNPLAVIAAANEVDPTFDTANPTARAKTAADFSSAGKSGQTVTSLNTASKHAAQLALASLDLHNQSGFPFATTWNSLANSAERGMGRDPLTNYNAVLDVYAPESTKVVSGKSNFAEKELEDIKSNYPGNASPSQILGAISKTNGLMLSRAEELQNTYNQNMGPSGQQKQIVKPEAAQAFKDLDALYKHSKDDTLNSKDAKEVIDRLEKYTSLPDDKTSQVAIPPIEQRVVGQTYPTPRGAMTWQGNGWLPATGGQ